MSAPSSEQSAIKRNGLRNPPAKSGESQRLRKKAVSANRTSNSVAANQAGKQNSNVNGPSGSAQANTGNQGKQKPRNNQRTGERTNRKANVSRNTKQPNPVKSSVSAAGKRSAERQDQEMADVGEDSVITKHLPRQSAQQLQKFTPEQVAAAGPVFPDPSLYGFMARQQPAKPRPVPRYMLQQPRLLAAPPFRQTPWDKANQEKMLQMESANSGADFQGIYEEFQKMRETERAKMEQLGLVDAENITKDLNDAIFFQGTCLDMCPTFERVRRSLENNVKLIEKDPVTQKISRERAVKAFSRPAAGQPPPIPSDVRPPMILTKTLDYIVDTILPQLPEAHSFIWDRTRSIRQDFVYQNYYGPEAIDCNERIVRIHLLSLHVMAGSSMEYSQQQELEQFNKALQTLTEIYSDVRNHGGNCPNESEFRAYHLISHFRDPELEREIQTLPDTIFLSPEVQLALRFRTIMSQNNVVERGYKNKIGAVNFFVEFFRLVFDASTPVLLACLLETHFNEIRFYALKSLSRSYHTKGKAFSAESLRQMLGFDTLSKLSDFVKYYDIDTFEENGELLVDLCNKEKLESQYKLNSLHDKPKRAPAYSPQLDYRFRGQNMQSFVNSGHSNADLGMNQEKMREVINRITNKQKIEENGVGVEHAGDEVPSVASNPPAFGQTTTVSSAFGATSNTPNQPVSGGSFNLSDFLTSKQTTASTQSFGQPSGALSGAPKGPAFDFTLSNKASTSSFPPKAAEKIVFGKLEEKHVRFTSPVEQKVGPAPKPKAPSMFENPAKSLFSPSGFGKSPEISGNDVPNQLLNKHKEKSELKNEASENKNVLNTDGTSQDNGSKPLPSFKSVETAIAKPPAGPKLLKNHKYFTQAVNSVYEDIVRKQADEEIRKIAANLASQQKRAKERNRLIDAFAEELYSAFVSEQIHNTMLESAAKAYCELNSKKRFIHRLQRVGRNLHIKHEERRQRKNEIELTLFKTPSLKKRSFSSSTEMPSKRRLSANVNSNMSYENIHERQEQVQQLWQPIELKKFVELCSNNAKAKLENGVVHLNCVIIAEDWNSSYSKWLNTKFSLMVSGDKTHYINEVQHGDLTVTFRSLTKPDFLNEKLFRSTPFIVFECGLLEEKQLSTYSTLEAKLTRDGGILQKLIQICDRFSYYKVQVLLLIWDISCSGITIEKRLELLKVNELTSTDNSVLDMKVCDMSESANVPKDLQDRLFKISEDFKGQLSKRGLHKRVELEAKSKMETENGTAAETSRVTAALQAKEAEILRRAKELKRRRYLSSHLTANKSSDLTSMSALRTPNGSFANHTLMNYNTFLGNNTFVGNNTFLSRDASFMRSLANASVLEESTPMASPGPHSRIGRKKGTASASKHSLPKKLQELREITESIKAKYKSGQTL